MPVQLARRADLTLDAYRAVAWGGEPVRLAASAKERIAAARRAFLALLERDPPPVIYGVTSGYGQEADRRLAPAERLAHARLPPYGATAAFGRPLPERVTRGIVFARLANFVEGHAAVSVELAEAVAAMLDGPPLPAVPMDGQGGAGEVQALGPLFIALAAGRSLGEKEALALINGSPCASALIADAALAAARRVALAERVFALSAEAIKAPLDAYDAALDALWEDPHEAASLGALRRLMAGGAAERRPYQAPVSYRILPRLLGQFRRAAAQAAEAAAISLRAVSDNPVFLPPDAAEPAGRVLSNGGYHNGKAVPALDALAAAMADLCVIADRHSSKLLDGRYSLLPDQLRAGEGYLGGIGMVQVGYAEQARRAAQRTLLPGSEGGGFGQNDAAPPTFLAWQSEEEAARCFAAALAMLAVVASQALHVTERPAPPALASLLAEVRATVPPLTGSRVLGPELQRLADAFAAEAFAA